MCLLVINIKNRKEIIMKKTIATKALFFVSILGLSVAGAHAAAPEVPPIYRIAWEDYYQMLFGLYEDELAKLTTYVDKELNRSDEELAKKEQDEIECLEMPMLEPEEEKSVTELAKMFRERIENFKKSEIELAQNRYLKRKCFTAESYKYDCSEQIFYTLDIQLSPELMKNYFEKYRVIVNRIPKHETLIIGCGNLRPYTEGLDVHSIDNYGGDKRIYRMNHTHKECDTIDPDFARNPTIVASFGATDITELFQGHKYKKILIEGVDITNFPYSGQLIYNLLAEDGIVDMGDRQYMGKSYLGSLIKSGKKVIF